MDKLPTDGKKISVQGKLYIMDVVQTCPPCFVCILVGQDMLLKLRGAYNEKQVISKSTNSSLMQTLRYYINKHIVTELGLWMVRFVIHDYAFRTVIKVICTRLYTALTETHNSF